MAETKKIRVKTFKTRELGCSSTLYANSIFPEGDTTRWQMRELYKKLSKTLPSFSLKLDKKCITFWGVDEGIGEGLFLQTLEKYTYQEDSS